MATEAHSSGPRPDEAPTSANVNTEGDPVTQTPTASSQQQQQQQQSSTMTDPQASPPLPARHIAVTPGARAQRLLKLFDSALTHTLAKISPENFAACYPTIAAQAPHALQSIQRGLVDRMGQLCQDEFGRTLERYEVIARLNELESLVGDAALRRKTATAGSASASASASASLRKGKGLQDDNDDEEDEQRQKRHNNNNNNDNNNRPMPPPHMLPAEAVLAAHLAPHLASQQSQLNARLQNTQAANVGLWAEIEAQRAEIEGLLGAVEGALRDVDGAAALMDEVPAEELARESRAVEAEMVDV